MLEPLTRDKFEQLIPYIATGAQYAHYWGKWKDLLNRLLISVVAVIVLLIVGVILPEGAEGFVLMLVVIAGLYWLWSPVYFASLRNSRARKFKYSGFWRCRIEDVFVTEELVNERESFDRRGELVIVENRERRINLILADNTGFSINIQAPLERIHQGIRVGEMAELLILSHRSDLATVDKITDAYIPSKNLWIGTYPWLQRDIFIEVSRELSGDFRPRYSNPMNRNIDKTRFKNSRRGF